VPSITSIEIKANGNSSQSAETSISKTHATQPAMGSISNDGPLSNPAAIVGMSFSFPQDAVSSDKFWSMLMQARCASEDFPASRLKKSAFYHSEAARQDSVIH
jgi:hypothetical protein